ncbi:hypothetical protein Y032_0006g3069 [Ancylostoma ceylanicum]|uniref:EGF-like domain-containing protein n=1 Tax=Ancylostoma ceylanicum TaxID=53326 RepID=A0A016VRG3_9BILA|nr:hypothetical protein Y032_0006g3069 [Ancylostoma ceylanicum]
MVRSPASVIFVAILVYSEAAGVPARVQTPHVQNGAANSMSRAAKLQCSENEVLDECSTVCERTCDDPSTENCKFFPPNGKCYPRCLCKEGYYRSYYHNNSITGVCVPAEVCMTAPCRDPNAGRAYCGMPENCKTTCKRGHAPEPCDASKCNLFDCHCKIGFVLDDFHGKCIPIEECKRCWKPNEEYIECSERCEPSCRYPNANHCTHLPACSPRCQCKEGFYRNSNGFCTNDCMKEPCKDPNAIRKPWALDGYCRPSCKDGNDLKFCTKPEYVRFECECKPGYIQERWNDKCIPIGECKK